MCIRDSNIPDTLPILPLRNTVLFPGVVIPINIGRDKSLKLIRYAYKQSALIGVIAQKAVSYTHLIAQGRVWTGKDAVKVGLVDVLGGLDDAIQIAAQKAKVSDYRIVEYPTEKDFMQELLNSFSASIKTNILKNELGDYYETFRQLQNTLNMPEGLITRIPVSYTHLDVYKRQPQAYDCRNLQALPNAV